MNLRRLRFVDRMHTVPLVKPQNVAEHTFNVMAILHHIGRDDLLPIALWHDAMEAVTGDIPSPFKRRLNEDGDNMLKEMEDRMREEHGAPTGTEHDYAVVKAADMLELIQTCLEERRMGNMLIAVMLDRACTYFVEGLSMVQDPEHTNLRRLYDESQS